MAGGGEVVSCCVMHLRDTLILNVCLRVVVAVLSTFPMLVILDSFFPSEKVNLLLGDNRMPIAYRTSSSRPSEVQSLNNA